MTVAAVLVAVLARVFPRRGRHQGSPGPDDPVVFPRLPPGLDDEDDEVTRLNLPRARPYVRKPPDMMP